MPKLPPPISNLICHPELSIESIRLYAESIGIDNVSQGCMKFLSEDVTYRLNLIIQDSVKFCQRSKRDELSSCDVDHSLKARNIDPQYGFQASDPMSFCSTTDRHKEIFCNENDIIELKDLISTSNVKIPCEPYLKSHWLALEGVQPAVPENPSISAPTEGDMIETDRKKPKFDRIVKKVKTSMLNTQRVHLKQLATHELSMEHQIYYKEITEACVGSEEGRRMEALQSLAVDTGVHQLMPRLSTFISEGVRINVGLQNMALLIYLMRMVNSLLNNTSIHIERYLHELLPSVITCIVCNELCSRPNEDNHWALREFATKQLVAICKRFTNAISMIQNRITAVMVNAIKEGKGNFATQYGAIYVLGELGHRTTGTCLIPLISLIGDRIERFSITFQGSHHSMITPEQRADAKASDKVINAVVKYASDFISYVEKPGDKEFDIGGLHSSNLSSEEEYLGKFGSFFGRKIFREVKTKKHATSVATIQPVTPVPSYQQVSITPSLNIQAPPTATIKVISLDSSDRLSPNTANRQSPAIRVHQTASRHLSGELPLSSSLNLSSFTSSVLKTTGTSSTSPTVFQINAPLSGIKPLE